MESDRVDAPAKGAAIIATALALWAILGVGALVLLAFPDEENTTQEAAAWCEQFSLFTGECLIDPAEARSWSEAIPTDGDTR